MRKAQVWSLAQVDGLWEIFQKKSKQVTERVEDIDFSGILKKGHVEIPGVN